VTSMLTLLRTSAPPAVATLPLFPPPVRWGGGYDPADDSLKFKEAVTLNRRFVLLPRSLSFWLGPGPLLLLVYLR
jgi:hypothetical protein